jgi:hypothetical protein
MKRIFSALCMALTIWSFSVRAEEHKPVIRLMPFFIEGMGQEESRLIEALIQSYLTDMGEVVLHSDSPAVPQGMALSRRPDYILSGSITLDQESRILMMEIIKTDTGETSYYSSIHKTTSDMVLKVRSLVETVFAVGSEEFNREPLSEEKVLGTWRGDGGIEIVRLHRGGTGMAILSSGSMMNLVYTIEDNALRVMQTSPNTERFYHPVPYEVAKELTARSEPWQWELSLYENGTILRGIKISTAVRYEENRVLQLIPGTIRKAEWIKSSR